MPEYESGVDPYLDPDSGLLRNKLGFTDKASLEGIEAVSASDASNRWQADPTSSSFDLKHLQAIHKQLFGKVYAWAGELRTVPIGKGGSLFALPQYIETALKPVFKELAQERETLAQATPEVFAQRAAYYMGEINAVHPFREGNGRTQREFIGQLANESGQHLRWKGISQQDMTAASIEAMHGNTDRMERLLIDNITEYGKEGMTMGPTMAVQPGHHETGALASMENPIHQLGGSAGRNEKGVIVGMDDKHITQSVDGGTRLIKQELGSIENANKLQVGQVVDIKHETDRVWTGRPEYTANVIENPLMSEGKIQEIVAAGSGVIRRELGSIRDERIVGAVNADREKLDLMERSFAKDHPEQVAIGRARVFVEAVELADIEKRREVNLEESQHRTITPDDRQGTQRRALELSAKSLQAAESSGIHMQHELKDAWRHEELHKEYQKGGFEHGD